MIKIRHPKLPDICNSYTNYIVNLKRKLDNKNRYIQYLFNPDNLRKIVCCPADKLSDIIKDFQVHFPNIDEKSDEWKKFCMYMTNTYKFIRKDYLFDVLKELNLSVCPYCNRQYIYTVEGGRRVSAQFDHFYSKTEYPYLALSFYNLIPCCPICNKAKAEEKIGVNPYLEEFGDECKIQIDSLLNCILQDSDWTLHFKGEEKYMKNIEIFVLDKLYEKHKDYAMEIVFKEIANERGYLDEIKKEYVNMGLNDNMINCILFNYDNNTDNHQRPLSKMTNDIIEQIRETLDIVWKY